MMLACFCLSYGMIFCSSRREYVNMIFVLCNNSAHIISKKAFKQADRGEGCMYCKPCFVPRHHFIKYSVTRNISIINHYLQQAQASIFFSKVAMSTGCVKRKFHLLRKRLHVIRCVIRPKISLFFLKKVSS